MKTPESNDHPAQKKEEIVVPDPPVGSNIESGPSTVFNQNFRKKRHSAIDEKVMRLSDLEQTISGG